MRVRSLVVGMTLVALLLTVMSGQSASAPRSSELRIASGSRVETFDPHNYRSVFDLLVDNLITDTLVGIDDQMRPVPRLALSWQQVNDVTWRFRLRPNVKFQDGSAFDAEAVKFNFERASKALKGQRFYGEIKEIRVVDPLTVEFVLNRPFAPFLRNLGYPVGGVVSPESIRRGVDPSRNLVGTGPFRLGEWLPNEHVVLVRNDTYWGRAPRLDRVVFRWIRDENTRHLAILRREVDISVDPPAHQIKGLRNSAILDLIQEPQARILWVGFNFKDPLLRNKALRQAIAYGIDRNNIVSQGLDNVPRPAVEGIAPPEVIRTQPPLRHDYSPDRARQALAESGVGAGARLSIWTPSGVWLGDKLIAEVVQTQLARIGINVSVRTVDYGTLVDAANRHEHQLWVILWGFSPHPDSFFRGVFHSKSAANWTAYANPEVDRLIDEAATVNDPQRMQQMYWQIQKILMDDVALVPIYHAVNLYVKSKRVQGFKTHPLELLDLSETRIEE
jgi:peptide/nickel transport system substrate-binding protein